MDDDRLVELVRCYDELFDMNHKKYTDNSHKDKIWKVIGQEIGRPGHECKVRWANLRDQYRRYLRKLNTKNGQDAKFRFADEMFFIKPFIRDRRSNNLEEDEMENGEEADVRQFRPRVKRSREEDQISDDDETSLQESEAAKRIRGRLPTKTEPSVKREESQTEEKIPNAVDLFFQSIAATVNKFSAYHQNICKTRVLAVVSELEMIELSSEHSEQAGATSAMFAHLSEAMVKSSVFESSS